MKGKEVVECIKCECNSFYLLSRRVDSSENYIREIVCECCDTVVHEYKTCTFDILNFEQKKSDRRK